MIEKTTPNKAYKCRSCGEFISSSQYTQFDLLCPECARHLKFSKKTTLCHECRVPTTFRCDRCNKYVCSTHSKTFKVDPSWRKPQLLCRTCGEKLTESRMVTGTCGGILLLIWLIWIFSQF